MVHYDNEGQAVKISLSLNITLTTRLSTGENPLGDSDVGEIVMLMTL